VNAEIESMSDSPLVPGLGRHDSRRLGFIPSGARSFLRNQVDDWGERTSRFRVLPDYLIVGAMRSGTSALYEYLTKHPRVARSTTEEVHYFTLHYERGVDWYRGHFPTSLRNAFTRAVHGGNVLTGEATPYYMFHPHAPYRIASLLPEVKLIVVLRNPVDRAYSHYLHARRVGVEPLTSFEEALEAEPERLRGESERMAADPGYKSRNHWHFSYLRRGMYAEQIEVLFSLFDRRNVLVLQSEGLLRDPAGNHAAALRHLGLPEITLGEYPRHNASGYPPMEEQTRRRLAEHFAERNERLFRLLGRDFGWEESTLLATPTPIRRPG
jgi:hypothetical protein